MDSEPKKKSLKRKFLIPPEFIVEADNVQNKISIADVRDLELYILSDTGPPAPKWISIRNKSFIKHVVTLLIPGLDGTKFGANSMKLVQPLDLSNVENSSSTTFFTNHFTHVWPTKSPGTGDKLFSAIGTFMDVPFTKQEKKKQQAAEMEANRLRKKNKNKLTPEDFLLSLDQMVEQGFPIHKDLVNNDTNDTSDDWVNTLPLHSTSKVFAIDCEMCETKVGKELTRVTVVDLNGKIIIDELVKPHEKIIDYLTQYSGITEELLADVTTRLNDVQEKLLQLISSSDIILGHSVESDLIALKLKHPKIIDTSILFQHPKGVTWKPALRWLTSKFLSREIQNQGAKGHDSVEDAIACVDLLNAKLKNGPDFGLTKVKSTNLIKKLATNDPPRSVGVAEYGVPHWHEEYAKSIISCVSDDEITENVVKLSQNHDFVWGRLRDLEKVCGYLPNQERGTDEEIEASYEKLNKRLMKLYERLPNNTALIVMSGSGDPREMSRLHKLKEQFQHEYKTKKWDQIECDWTDSSIAELNKATERARNGISFLTIKTIDNENGIVSSYSPSSSIESKLPILTIGSKVESRSKRSRSDPPLE